MKAITHINARTIDEAVNALGTRAEVVAGGTDLIGYMKAMVSPNAPDTLVNIKTIPNLSYIKEEGGVLKIGALTSLEDIATSSAVQSKYTALGEAASKVGSLQLRCMGTIAGNICQRVRCWYYRLDRNHYNCLRKDPATGLCQAQLGDNRYHSIFGAMAGCVAVNPSDTAPALVALSATIKTTKRDIAAESFFAVRGEKTTVLDDNEVVTEIQVPAPPSGAKSAFVKFALRKSWDFPVVNCAAMIGGGEARICLNAVYNVPRRATAAENAIRGQAINAANAEAAGSAAVQGATPLPNNKWMIQIARAVVKKTILACA